MSFGRQFSPQINLLAPSSGLAQAGQRSLALNPDRAKRQNYLNDLQEQIKLKEYRKKMERLQEEQEELKVQREQQEYQYFGRAGAGGLRRDIFGNVITSKKCDPSLISNLYGRQQYNRKFQIAEPMVREEQIVNTDHRYAMPLVKETVPVKETRDDYGIQLELQRRIEEEKAKRERMEKELEEERMKREEQSKMLRQMQEEEAKRQQEFERAMLIKSFEARNKVNVKLQADLEPEEKEGEVDEREFVMNLPAKIRSHLTNVVDHELSKLVAEMRHEEDQIVDSIMSLKVSSVFKPRKKYAKPTKRKKTR